jgi:chemotaxis protein methyltransferase CheR
MMSIHHSPHGMLRPELRTAFRELIEARTGIRLNDAQVRGLDELIAGLVMRAGRDLTPDQLYAAFSAGERADLFRDFAARVTIGETHFFRVAPQIAALREMVFPDLIQRRASTRRLTLWSAGCSSGEEPYTLAILLRELVPTIDTWDVRLFATDLSEPALDTARRAVYREWSFRETPGWVRQRYFTAQGDLWQLADAIRQMVRFERVNLVAAPYPPSLRAESSLDLILCRNVTIYFNHSVSHDLYRRFAASLTPGGWLILGPSDPPPPRDTGLEPVYLTNAIVWRKPLTVASAAPRPAERESPAFATLVLPPARPRITRPVSNTSPRAARPDLSALTTPTERLAAIRSQFEAGDRDSASAALEQLTRDAPLLTAAHRLVGLLALERGDTATALESLRRATFLAPEDPLAQYGLGRTYRALGDAVRASAALRHARRILAPLSGESLIVGEEALTVDKLRRALDAQLALLDSGKGETR